MSYDAGISNLTRRTAATLAVVGLAAALAACSSTSSPGPTSAPKGGSTSASNTGVPGSTSPGGTSSSQQVEVNPPGDIPDNQAFVPYSGKGFTVSVPEGWARTQQPSAVVFQDKYNSITITSNTAAAAPTVASARRSELPAIQAKSKAFAAGAITSVQRKAGGALLITYHALSSVNPVTGKVANEAVERYEFWRAGREVVLTLSAPVGSDNVDPWRKVTDSFIWTGK